MTRRLLWSAATVLWLLGTPVPAAEDPVSLELGTEQGIPIGSHQRWDKYLREFGFSSIRIRNARPGEQPQITTRGTDDSPRYYVYGILTAGNRMELPGGTFRIGDTRQLTAWLEKLRGGGTEGVTAARGAYGMTAQQLLALQDATKTAVTFSTKGQLASDVIQQLSRSVRIQIEVDALARAALAGGDKVRDEMKGLSCGTTLAAAVRPLGLVVIPTIAGRTAMLRVTRSTGKEDAWPIGFDLSGAPANVAPSLFRWVNVEINKEPLEKAIAAIQSRLEIPILFDHNALAKHETDMNTPVSFGPRKTFYANILKDLLFQAMLRSELKVDEAAKPFLWITTLKK